MSGIEPGGFVHHTTLIERGVTVMRGARVWAFCHLMEGCLIGPDVNIGAYCQIDRGVVIPFATRIGNGVWVYKGVEMTGSDIFVGPGVRFTNDKYPENNNPDWRPERTIIRSRVSIGAGAIILPGIELDEECRIAAGAIVTKDVPAGELVKGKW